MNEYKNTTRQIVAWSEGILAYLKSDTYKNSIVGQDISSQSSPYRVSEQTFLEAIETLVKFCDYFAAEVAFLDKIDGNQRQNIYNLVQNLHSWITQNPLGNWNNIISYVNSIVQSSIQAGMNPFIPRIDTKIEKKLSKVHISNEEIEKIEKLRSELEVIKNSEAKLSNAKEIIDFVSNTNTVDKVAKYVEDKQGEIDELTQDAKDLLSEASAASLVKDFAEAKTGHAGNEKLNINLVYFSFLLLAINLGLVFWAVFDLEVHSGESLYEVIRNITTTALYTSPSILFVYFSLSNFRRDKNLEERYEFKATQSGTVRGQLESLKQLGVSTETLDGIAQFVVKDIYTNPFNGKLKQPQDENAIHPIEDFVKQVTDTLKSE